MEFNTNDFLFGSAKTAEEIFKEIIESYRNRNCEIELRLGQIIDKYTNSRLSLNALNPVIIDSSGHSLQFVPGVLQPAFNAFLFRFCRPQIPVVEKNDTVYITKDGRYIFDKEKRCVEANRKKREKTIDIFFPGKSYDVRLSISSEIPIAPISYEEAHRARISVRERNRKTVDIGDFKFEFTKVVTNAKASQGSDKFEVEVECKNSSFDLNQFYTIAFGIS